MAVILPAYAFIVVGGYRAAFGKTPVAAHPGELSIKRVVFAVATVLAVMAALVGFVFIAEFVYELLQRRP